MSIHEPRYLRNATIPGLGRADIRVERGRIAGIGPDLAPQGAADDILECDGRPVICGLIDGHLHLDKTFLGMPWRSHAAEPTVSGRIAYEKRQLASLGTPTAERASRLVRLALGNGTTAMRTHVDIDPEKRLTHLHALLEVRDRYRDIVDMQIVAFPQSGVVSQPGVAELLDAAIREGADLVGGIDPATIDGDLEGQLDSLFGIAARHEAGIDIHLHNTGEVGIAEIEAIVERARTDHLAGRVTLSHAHALGAAPIGTAMRLAEGLAEAGISVVTACPGAIPLPPAAILRSAGVVLFAGSDNVRDSWSPYGNADMLERVMLFAYRSGYRRDDEIEGALNLATSAAAAALELDGHSLAVGNAADLVVLDGGAVTEAIVTRSPRRLVYRQGRLVAENGATLDL